MATPLNRLGIKNPAEHHISVKSLKPDGLSNFPMTYNRLHMHLHVYKFTYLFSFGRKKIHKLNCSFTCQSRWNHTKPTSLGGWWPLPVQQSIGFSQNQHQWLVYQPCVLKPANNRPYINIIYYLTLILYI